MLVSEVSIMEPNVNREKNNNLLMVKVFLNKTLNQEKERLNIWLYKSTTTKFENK